MTYKYAAVFYFYQYPGQRDRSYSQKDIGCFQFFATLRHLSPSDSLR